MAAKDNNNAMTAAIIIGGALIFYDKIFGKSQEQKQLEQEASTSKSKVTSQTTPVAQDPTLDSYVAPKPPKGYTVLRKKLGTVFADAAKQISKAIGNNVIITSYNRAQIVDAVKQALTKPEINLLWRTYKSVYKRDLTYDLDQALKNDPDTIKEIYSYINKLPNYTKQ